MTTTSDIKTDPLLDLVLERDIDVSPDRVWDAWTKPEHVKMWFTPKPWSVTDCEIDLRPGGIFRTMMRSPEGEEFPNVGCFLDVMPKQRLVFTDALLPSYRPSGKSFMTAMLMLTPRGNGTHYKAVARHADEANRKQHEEMGFHTGWGTSLDQLVAYVKSW